MSYSELDRKKIRFKPLSERTDKVFIERDHVSPTSAPQPFDEAGRAMVDETIARIVRARDAGKPRMLAADLTKAEMRFLPPLRQF